MIIASDLEWSRKGVDVLGLSWDGGRKATATDRTEETLEQYLSVLKKADIVVGQNFISADCRQLAKEGIDVSWLEPKVYDIRLAFHALNSHLAGTGSFDIRSILLLLGSQGGERFPTDWKQYESDLHRTCALDSAAAGWAYTILDPAVKHNKLENTVAISHLVEPIFARMQEQGLRLDKRILEQIYYARKAKTEEIIEKYHLWEERGKKVIKRIPIWRSDKVLDIFEHKFGIRPVDRQRKTWVKLLNDPKTSPEAKEFAEVIIDLGKGANDQVWFGKAEEEDDGVDFSKLDEDGFIHPRYDVAGSPDRAIASNPNCFDAKTEILTKCGWVKFPDLEKGVPVAQWSNGSIQFVTPTAYQAFPYTGAMVTLYNKRHVSLRVTAEHRCLLIARKTGNYQVVMASNYLRDSKQLHAGHLDTQSSLPLSNAQLTLLCAMQADGTWTDTVNPSVEWAFSKSRKIERLTTALQEENIPYKVTTKPKTTRIGDKTYNTYRTRIRVGVGELPDLLFSYLGQEKTFGPWVLQLSKEQLQYFCDELFNWDGLSTKRNNYGSVVETNVDWAQIAFALINKRATKRVYWGALSKQPHYQIDISRYNASATSRVTSSTEQVTSEPVYCISVPSTFIMVRREGRICITGNCQNFPRPGEDPRPIPLRSAVIPLQDDHILLGVDFSSLETITNAYESGDMDRVQATLDKRITHEGTAALINEKFGLNLSRQQGKNINHGFDKGESPYNLARALFKTERPSRQQAAQCMAISMGMLEAYPKTAKFRDSLWERSVDNPLIVTNSFGRRLMCFSRAKYGDADERYAKHDPSKKYWCSCSACGPRRDRFKYAIAFLGRSAGFDALLRKMSVIWYEKRLDQYSLPTVECHDELLFSVPKDKAEHYAQIVKQCFEEPIAELNGLSLPASVVLGDSWAAAH